MFRQSRLLFLYAITPVHMGAGEAIGVIDNPIQRECHTRHPNAAGSGLKGAIRHQSMSTWENALVNRLFGPESTTDNLHAGAVSFGDAQIVAFPVRSLKEGYIYAVSPISLARLKRLALLIEKEDLDWNVPLVSDDKARVADPRTLSNNTLILESYQFEVVKEQDEDMKSIAEWLSRNALPDYPGNQYFADKIKKDLVLLPDQAFSYFVEHSTSIEPHVRIDEETGSAVQGGLFYTENLPPESLLVAPLFCSDERSGSDQAPDSIMKADEIIEKLKNSYNDQLLQIGGDSTTGRGQVILHFMET